ncbi:MAG: RNA polymerase sigma factor [Flavobacteriales bacterium]
MANKHTNISLTIENLFRQESGKMLSVLIKIFGSENFQLAEDVIQDTMIIAIDKWEKNGLPEHPIAWLYRVAKNKAIDLIRRQKHCSTIDFSDPERKLLTSEYTLSPTMNSFWQEDQIKDDFLGMMYACCHPDLSLENQISFILKALCGFSTHEIAKAFLTSEDTVSKRIYRTKFYFRKHKIKPKIPSFNEIRPRTKAVLNTIYLMFNEGYNSSHSDDLIRKDIISQALFLNKSLLEHKESQLPESYALMALMYFHSSRLEGRLNTLGNLVILRNQNRSIWNQDMITLGNHFMNKAAFGAKLSTYHLEAAIAFEHCISPSYNETNWNNIIHYYNLLYQLNNDPVVYLNRCLVVLEIDGPFKALKEINLIKNDPFLQKYYLYYAIMGSIHEQIDLKKQAKMYFQKALLHTKSSPEISLLKSRIKALDFE